ncbi:MAG: DUF4340 domain-containing protein [bacterium]|nr:DUF4340 domain-containing protein [bacterium]
MKSIKSLFMILLLLVIVGGIYFLMQKANSILKTPFKNKEITQIEIQATDTLCRFEKIDNKWELVSPVKYPMDTMLFSRFFDGLSKLEIGQIVSSRKERHQEFEVAENGIKITAWTGKTPFTFILGKQSPDFINSYLRFPDKNEVYFADGVTKWMVNRSSDEWRDSYILAFNPQELSKLIVKDKEIICTDTLWTCNNKPANKDKMNDAKNTFSNLRADGFSKEPFQSDFTIKLFLSSGDRILNIGKKINDKYQLTLDTNPTVFLISDLKIQKLNDIIFPPKPEPKPKVKSVPIKASNIKVKK